jgi:outer membrane scaffolding protein for murein synthesis (MipA/OmpV family)
MRPLGAGLALGLSLLAAAPVRADQPLWELGLGAGALRLPHYRGADQSRSWLLPVPYAIYRGDFLKADRDGARAVLLDSERVDLDLSLAATPPTRSKDNAARRGMPDLAPIVEFGPNLNVLLSRSAASRLQLRLPLRAGWTLERGPRQVGLGAAPHLNLDLRWQGWNLGLQGGLLWGDRKRHAYFYEVDPAYASATRPAYRARGGYAGWDATLALSTRRGNLWTGGYLRLDRLDGARFADSPLVKTRGNWSAGLAMAWVLKTSDTRVPDTD